MKTSNRFSRREFLTRTSAAVSALAVLNSATAFAETPANKRYRIVGFSKPFQTLNFEETAELVEQVGWDGIECAVRQKGHVLPERVEEDLPKMVEAMRKRSRELLIMATDIHNTTDPLTEKVLRAASKLGIKTYRLAHLSYNPAEPILPQLANRRAELRDLVALNKELGMCGVYQNHSGNNSFGAPVWDLYEVLKDFDPKHVGVCFDIGHATVEGGYAWRTHFRLVENLSKAVIVKDFAWKKKGEVWTDEWCPLGEGMINKSFFQMLKKTAFNGPIVQHHEYPLGTGAEMVKALKKDLDTLKEWLAAAA